MSTTPESDDLRKKLHVKFRDLGYTTHRQTYELLDIVFETALKVKDEEIARLREAYRTSLIKAAAAVVQLRTWGLPVSDSVALDDQTRRLAQSLKNEYDALAPGAQGGEK